METVGDALLQARDLTKRFFRKGRDSAGYFEAVSDVNLDLHAGELAEVKGRSGSGKSTLLNMLAGLLQPTEGIVELDGQDVYALDDAKLSRLRNERMGVVPQAHAPLQALTVVQNVALPYLMYRKDDGVEERALGLLDDLGIRALADCYPDDLSGGELRRMSIARALICNPAIILADEPTGDLDEENTDVVFRVLRKVADDGAAVLVVTHDQSAARYADTAYTMNSGKLS